MQGTEKIISTNYDATAERLCVTFESGRAFVFDKVPWCVAELLAIDSDPAKYFDGWIRSQFEWFELSTDVSPLMTPDFVVEHGLGSAG